MFERNRTRAVHMVLLALLCLAVAPAAARAQASPSPTAPSPTATPLKPVPLKTGHAFRQALQGAVNIVLPRAEVRNLIDRLATMHGIAIVLDRRIDPNRRIDAQLTQLTLLDGLKFLASQIDAEAAVIGATVVIGLPESLDRIRTDIALQQQALKDRDGEEIRQRTFALLQGRTVRWDDLQTPAQLLGRVADQFELTVDGLELVPHDLWADGVLSKVDAPEALALVAGQFDLTFAWNDDLTRIRLTPSPARLTVEHVHEASRDRIEAALPSARTEFPRAKLERSGRRLRVTGTVGEQEQIARLLDGDSAQEAMPAPDLGPLRNRTFTITTKRATVVSVLRYLETSGVRIIYDPQLLAAAGIDLSRKVTLSLKNATAEELFRSLCEPLGLAFEIEGKTVKLTPPPESPESL